MGKGLLIIILGSTITMGIVSITFWKTSNSGTDNALEYFEDIQSRNYGNSMVNMLLSRLADSASYRVEEFEKKEFGDADHYYRVVDTALDAGDSLIKIEVVVDYNGYPKNITTYTAALDVAGWIPPVVRAAWTANGNLNNTISDMYIDGRDHDLNFEVIPKMGAPAVSLSQEFTNDDGAALAGTYNGIDYRLKYPENPKVVEEFYTWGGNFPKTPDEILGYPEGTLKALAQSGAGGGQYLNNPYLPGGKAEIDFNHLSFPLSGVTYVELSDGIERNFRMYGGGHEGILVVHGPGATSRLKGLKIDPWVKTKKPKVSDGDPITICHHPGEESQTNLEVIMGSVTHDDHLAHGDMNTECPDPADSMYFAGLIVTDFSFHHHLDILGAMLQLSENLEVDKNCNGNKDHWVYYSRAAIEAATQFTADETGLVGNSYNLSFPETGFGNGRVKSTYWFE